MEISIALATFNGSKFIGQQLESIKKQTVLPSELVVCDDCSTDDTLKILNEFKIDAPFSVKIYSNPHNLGYLKNFEKALTLCSGDLLFLCDQDDYWFSDKIEKVLSYYTKNFFVYQNDMILTDEFLNPTKYTQLKNIRKVGLSDDTFVAGCGTAIRKEWLEVVLPFPENFVGHDNWIHRFATFSGFRKLIEEPLQLYRRHAHNSSQGDTSAPKNISVVQSAYKYGLISSKKGWENELVRLHQTLERFKTKKQFFVDIDFRNEYELAIKKISSRIEAYKLRVKYTSKKRILRVFPLIYLYLTGGYKHFKGVLSLVKDIIRK